MPRFADVEWGYVLYAVFIAATVVGIFLDRKKVAKRKRVGDADVVEEPEGIDGIWSTFFLFLNDQAADAAILAVLIGFAFLIEHFEHYMRPEDGFFSRRPQERVSDLTISLIFSTCQLSCISSIAPSEGSSMSCLSIEMREALATPWRQAPLILAKMLSIAVVGAFALGALTLALRPPLDPPAPATPPKKAAPLHAAPKPSEDLIAQAAPAGDRRNTMVGGAPMYETRNIVENAVRSRDHSTLVAAVKAAGLVDTLEGAGPFTIFAPTNEAFKKLPASTVDNLLKPDNKVQLRDVLTYHVVPGALTIRDLKAKIKAGGGKAELTTVQGEVLTAESKGQGVDIIDSKGHVAHVTIPNIAQSNGIIHVINSVLMP